MKILCAVRGGAQSQLTVTRAVELAREDDAELVFLYVVDAEFLGYATVGRPSVILKELRTTGAFMMEMLRERVAHDGIETDYVVRTGDVQRQIIESIRWQDADILVMGRPVKSPGTNTFTEKSFKQFVEHVREATTVDEIVIAEMTPPTASSSDDTSA